jgi:MFS-type transporter involved in bile tolerance (Atg22 family)
MKNGGTAMFALLALAGDLGGSLGPAVLGSVSKLANDNLKMGVLAGIVFPILMIAGLIILRKKYWGGEKA